MKTNETGIDSVIRIFAAVLLLYLGFGGELTGALAIAADMLGVILLLTGVIGFCPLYAYLDSAGQKSKSSIQGARVQLPYCALIGLWNYRCFSSSFSKTPVPSW